MLVTAILMVILASRESASVSVKEQLPAASAVTENAWPEDPLNGEIDASPVVVQVDDVAIVIGGAPEVAVNV
jgi:hypothetical protein